MIISKCAMEQYGASAVERDFVTPTRFGDLPSFGALDRSTTMALAYVLVGMVWMRATKKQRSHIAPRRRELFVKISRDYRAGSPFTDPVRE